MDLWEDRRPEKLHGGALLPEGLSWTPGAPCSPAHCFFPWCCLPASQGPARVPRGGALVGRMSLGMAVAVSGTR